jgi:hypothetical protein
VELAIQHAALNGTEARAQAVIKHLVADADNQATDK